MELNKVEFASEAMDIMGEAEGLTIVSHGSYNPPRRYEAENAIFS